nr:hypothetical protein CFP56_08102 [Quercus suber]
MGDSIRRVLVGAYFVKMRKDERGGRVIEDAWEGKDRQAGRQQRKRAKAGQRFPGDGPSAEHGRTIRSGQGSACLLGGNGGGKGSMKEDVCGWRYGLPEIFAGVDLPGG